MMKMLMLLIQVSLPLWLSLLHTTASAHISNTHRLPSGWPQAKCVPPGNGPQPGPINGAILYCNKEFKFFAVRMVRHCHRLPRGCGCPDHGNAHGQVR